MKCFWGHNLKAIRVEHSYLVNCDDNSRTGKGETLIYWKCVDCGKTKYEEVRGLWNLEDLNNQK